MNEHLAKIDNATAAEVEREVARLWKLAQSDAATQRILDGEGVDTKALGAIGENPFSVSPEGGNRADIATAILIGIGVKIGSDLGSKAITALWEKLMRPQLEKRFPSLRSTEDTTE